jgi:glyoxylase-like metal-dependent hydrolase (beta-lactamase superfamily II)
VAELSALPGWCRLVRADNPGPMTLEGTNTYLLRVDDGLVVVDPGPLDDDHLRRVADAGDVVVTVLTHGHPDHAEGAARFAELTGSDVRAFDPAHCHGAATPLEPGERLDVAGLEVEVLATPGHTADSVSFVADDGRERAVLTGDTILGRGTTVVAHPDGALAPYLDSLVHLRGLGPVTLLPGHGPVRPDAGAVAAEYLEHRAERLEQVREAVDRGADTARDVVRVVYADVDESLWPAAELSVRAQLDYLTGRRPDA